MVLVFSQLQAQLAYKELKRLQSAWASQNKSQFQLDQFTLVGKGAPVLINNNLLTVSVRLCGYIHEVQLWSSLVGSGCERVWWRFGRFGNGWDY